MQSANSSSLTHHGAAPAAATRHQLLGRSAAVLLGSVFVALCAQLSVPLPWTPVPMTMQPFGVLLVALVLGPWLGMAAMVAYLLEGAAGLPVFVPGFGGLFPLGLSSGYLLAYPFAALAAGLAGGRAPSMARSLVGSAAGEAVILLGGTAWLATLTHAGMAHAARFAVLPFLAGDSIKVMLAAVLAAGIARTLARRTPQTPR